MSSKCRRFATPTRRPALSRARALFSAAAAILFAANCGSDLTPPGGGNGEIKLASIVIDGGSRQLERGVTVTMTATVTDTGNKKVTVPLAWRSSVDSIASFGPNGVLTTKDTGVTVVTASALGVTSGAITIHVVQVGAASVAAFNFSPPLAVTPSQKPADSIRVQVKNLALGPAAGTLVLFAVTGGGGTVSPTVATTNSNGVAATAWTLGPNAGKNTVTATVVAADSITPLTYVAGSPTTFTVTSFLALAAVQGDKQSGSVLAALPVAPSVRLVDSLGKPRPGIPISFAPNGNGRVARPVVSTDVDGVASPGIWTLGDLAGDEQLVVTVESAKLILHATATGTTIRFSAANVTTAQAATCALTADQFASCLGQWPQIGTGDSSVNQSTPTLTKGGLHFTSLVGGAARFCGTTADLSIYCWGINPLIDTSTATSTHQPLGATGTPTRLPSNIAWVQVSVGGQHTCALANDKTAYCWGADTDGQLGDNGSDARNQPASVVGGFKFSTLAAGGSHECGITTDGATFCWGLNSSGQLGDGSTVTRRLPTAVSGTVKLASIAAGQSFTCGLDAAGGSYCWGAGTAHQTPIAYAGAPKFSSLSVGAAHACALTNDGTAYCWGDNSSGQLGDSTTTSRTEPTVVSTEIRFKSISAGFQHTCGISTDGFLVCWGKNQFGELGFSTPLVQTTPRFIVLEVKP